MNDTTSQPDNFVNIAAVERDTGLSKDTLRVWERRYGFPAPVRDRFGERLYPSEQVDRLRLIRRLMNAGHRPGKIIGLPAARLQDMAAEVPIAPVAPADSSEHDVLQRFLDIIRQHDLDVLRHALAQALLKMGLERFVIELVAPLSGMVGAAWARGEFEIFEEHLYTESVQAVLRGAIASIAPPEDGPRVLLTTFPQEVHSLGMLMAEALMVLDGCRCLSLGVQTPIRDIARAARAQRADIVALSFSAHMNPNHVLGGLVELRAELPHTIEIWAGGQNPVLKRRPPPEVKALTDLHDIRPALAAWRSART